MISMMLTCYYASVVVVVKGTIEEDQGFVMQESIGNITTIVGTEI